MNKNILGLILSIFFIASACAPKQEEIIAIDVLLTLPKEMDQQAIQLNQAIVKDNPTNFTLDKNHIPHITLLQCYIPESDLSNVAEALKGLYKTVEHDTLWADNLQYTKEKEESFSSIRIKKSNQLVTLHKKVIALVKPYMVTNGSQESYVQNTDDTPIDQFTIDYVPVFVPEHSFENYNPHISLGVAKTSLLDSLNQNNFRPTKFQATSISVYQLGSFGTAQKLLWQSE
ncbi:2'-5' RNA ligase family protein [Marixanthomonas ophiurae]|uniref:2'-5' RNA ligase family protein n=1 Tax=Marixanthomonas ophiurae TaxID=387659 RepID=A0A3E1QAA7_9FLAO|nr:2'-5' RNA ligase family protein [Marixanthomonas ophiurae]RFN59056.1 hypothetical protein DZ858_02965 [Marixanthomonas ophiurae]